LVDIQPIFLLKYFHFYSLISVYYHYPSSFSLFDNKSKQHRTPVPVAARVDSYPSVFEQTAQNFLYLPDRADI
jgi:hypothetical protein